MILIIECVVLCGLFTLAVLRPLYKNPLNMIMSYPTAIRKRVESLPQYEDSINSHKKKHLSVKLLFVFVCIVVMALVAWFSGKKDFQSVFFHVFILFFIVNIYDLLVLDIWLFCYNKRVIIPGTEDMIREYRNPIHHIRGAVIGTLIGLVVALAAGGAVELFKYIVGM